MMLRQMTKYGVVDGEDRRGEPQGQQNMLGGVKKLGIRQQTVETNLR